MNDPAAFTWLPFFGLGWIIVAVVVSIIFRKRRGKPLFPKAPDGALFSERRCSGRSLQTPWAKIGGARNCLLVAVTPKKLVVTPLFPFNLILLPEIYGLDHNIDISAIREAFDRKSILGRSVTITYADPKVRRIELRLRHHNVFIRTLRQLGASVTTA